MSVQRIEAEIRKLNRDLHKAKNILATVPATPENKTRLAAAVKEANSLQKCIDVLLEERFTFIPPKDSISHGE